MEIGSVSRFSLSGRSGTVRNKTRSATTGVHAHNDERQCCLCHGSPVTKDELAVCHLCDLPDSRYTSDRHRDGVLPQAFWNISFLEFRRLLLSPKSISIPSAKDEPSDTQVGVPAVRISRSRLRWNGDGFSVAGAPFRGFSEGTQDDHKSTLT
ncbi:hypothetical protein LZ32DRAFT_354683 [Colletotrichum eremochloae]|nr:hypothetical protein LZ32DRAFT_354683 [Colletotrichum eremochloae]